MKKICNFIMLIFTTMFIILICNEACALKTVAHITANCKIAHFDIHNIYHLKTIPLTFSFHSCLRHPDANIWSCRGYNQVVTSTGEYLCSKFAGCAFVTAHGFTGHCHCGMSIPGSAIGLGVERVSLDDGLNCVLVSTTLRQVE